MPEPPSKSRRAAIVAWLVAIIGTLAVLVFQDRTGPTFPIEGTLETPAGPVGYLLPRSETIGTDLVVLLRAPLPSHITGHVRYRRYTSDDEWATVEMVPGTFGYNIRGRRYRTSGLGATLPSLTERAGKYEYFADVGVGSAEAISLTGDNPVLARYKGAVPTWVLVVHIGFIFVSLLLALRAGIAALFNQPLKVWVVATTHTLLTGGMVMGPLVQWYAFGVWWAGLPFGWDWTDNKVLLEVLVWVAALYANRGQNRCRWIVLVAVLVAIAVYLIPHSLFGSEFNYQLGAGQGTAG